jgi:hypothetical protein
VIAGGAGLFVGVVASVLFGVALVVYGRWRGRTLLGLAGLVLTFVLGTLFGVLVAAVVTAVFAVAIHRTTRVGSEP